MSVQEKVTSRNSIEGNEQRASLHILVLYNDDYNTFDHVINCLIDICKHDALQAEQCAYLVHYTGKTDIMSGELHELSTCKQALVEKGLSVVIEKAN